METSGAESILEEARAASKTYKFAENSIVFVFGSLAEGYGNARSDMDLLVLEPEENAQTRFRHVSWNGNRRVEAFFRKEVDLITLADRILAISEAPLDDEPNLDELEGALDFFHRVVHALPVIGDISVTLRAVLSAAPLARARVNFEKQRARRAFHKSLAMSSMGDIPSAYRYAQKCLEHSAGAYCSAAGLTYNSGKFLEEKLKRAGIDDARAKGLLTRIFCCPHIVRAADVTSLGSMVEGLCKLDFEGPLTARLQPGLQIKEIGGVLLITGRVGTFVVPETSRRMVRCLEAGIGLHDDLPSDDRQELRKLYENGLVTVSLGKLPLLSREFRQEAAEEERSVRFSCSGIKLDASRQDIVHIPISFASIVAGGMAALNAGFIAANAREDAVGAMDVERWSEVDFAYRTLAATAISMLQVIDFGYDLIPFEEFASYCERSRKWPKVPELLNELGRGLVTSRGSALARFALIQELFSIVPEAERLELIDAMDTAAGAVKAFHYKLLWGHAALDVGLEISSEWRNLISLYNADGSAKVEGVHRVKEEFKSFDWRVDENLTLPLNRLSTEPGENRDGDRLEAASHQLKGW